MWAYRRPRRHQPGIDIIKLLNYLIFLLLFGLMASGGIPTAMLCNQTPGIAGQGRHHKIASPKKNRRKAGIALRTGNSFDSASGIMVSTSHNDNESTLTYQEVNYDVPGLPDDGDGDVPDSEDIIYLSHGDFLESRE